MIVLGIDPHKKSHTAVAVEAATGEPVGEITVPATDRGHGRLLAWARDLAPERRFALEDCRHVSGRLERFLVERGESCVRVPPKLMAGVRRSARTRGKSDPIDAACVARAALREPDLPEARIARELTGRCRALNAEIGALEAEVGALAGALAPELLALPGVGGLTAARLVGETAGAARFASAARFAMHSGVAPVPVSSGRSDRYRLNRRGNRRLNCALHRIAVTQMRMHDPARAYLERRRAEGKTKREALRCLKRHLARSVWRALRAAEARREAMLAATTTSTQPASVLAS